MKSINSFFNLLGFNEQQREIYKHLLSVNESTILSISKNTNIERTKVYREVEYLISQGYLFERILYKTCHKLDYCCENMTKKSALVSIMLTFKTIR